MEVYIQISTVQEIQLNLDMVPSSIYGINSIHGLLNYTAFQLDSTVNYRRLKTELEVFQYDDKNVIKTSAVYLT